MQWCVVVGSSILCWKNFEYLINAIFYRSIIDMHKSRKDKSRQKKFLPIKRNSRVSLCCQTLPFIKLSKLSSLFVKDLISHYMFSIRIPVYSSDWGMDAFHSFIYSIEYQCSIQTACLPVHACLGTRAGPPVHTCHTLRLLIKVCFIY